MVQVTTTVEKYREAFADLGPVPTRWSGAIGAGMAASVTSAGLVVTTGTTPGAVTTLTLDESAATPALQAIVVAQLSQKIANCSVFIEVVDSDATQVAAWCISGNDSTNAATARYEVLNTTPGNSAAARMRSGEATVATAVTSLQGYEIELTPQETRFYTRVPDSTNGRSTGNVFNSVSPDPQDSYKIRLRFVNGATDPASSTTVTVRSALLIDYSELTAELTGARGGTTPDNALPVLIAGGTVGVNGAGSSAQRPVVNETTETTTALAANGIYVGASREFGTDATTRPTRTRWTYQATAAALGSIAHLVLEESTDGTGTGNGIWRETQRTPLPADGNPHTGEWSVGHFRYYRYRVLNGITAQTALYLTTLQVRGDGSTADCRGSLQFPVTPAAGAVLAASASVISPTLDLGANHQWDKIRISCLNKDATASGTLRVLQSPEGASWHYTGSSAAGANGSTQFEVPVYQRYLRFQYDNGTTAASQGVVVNGGLTTL